MYRKLEELKKFSIPTSASLREAVYAMDAGHFGFIALIDDQFILHGILTDGDFRRAILDGIDLDRSVQEVMNGRPEILYDHELSPERIRKAFNSLKATVFPVVNTQGRLVDIIFESDLQASRTQVEPKKNLRDIALVIMAGGHGTRLGPLTKILPKVLMPIGDRPVIELIMESFSQYGIRNFYLSLYHKARMVRVFFDGYNTDNAIYFLEEKEPLGTAGALRLLQGKMRAPFFVSNCDILLDTDYTHVYEFHTTRGNDFTLIGSMQHHTVPYGVCRIKNGGDLQEIKEKPGYDFLINTGVYLLNPDILEYIPQNQRFDMTDLITALQSNGKRIGVFPISEKAWVDIGQLEEYKKNLDILNRQ